MWNTIASLAPIFAIMAAGYLARRWKRVPAKAWLTAEKLGFYLLMPALIVYQIAGAPLKELNVGAMAGTLCGAVLAMSALLLAVRRPLSRFAGVDGAGFTSIFQGATRSNFFISLVAIEAGFGPEGTLRAIIGLALMPPLMTAISVPMLARYAGDKPADPKRVLILLAKNPFIYAAALGFALNLSGLGRPPIVGPALGLIGKGALPIALLCVGSSLDFSRLRAAGRAVIAAVGLKLLGLPLLAGLFAFAFGLDQTGIAIAVIFHCPPAAAASYVMARQMGGDYVLMASILTLQTAAAAIVLPLFVLLLAR